MKKLIKNHKSVKKLVKIDMNCQKNCENHQKLGKNLKKKNGYIVWKIDQKSHKNDEK